MARRIEIWPADRLAPYARNARTHSPEQVAQIAASIVEFGFVNPVLVDTNAGIVAGHGRLLAARKLGLAEVPVVVLDHLTETQRRAYVIADNRLALNAGWDEALLAEELRDLKRTDSTWLWWVSPTRNSMRCWPRPTNRKRRIRQKRRFRRPRLEAVTRPGDVWLIGKHRLICGDCRDLAAVQKLLDGARPTWSSRRRRMPRSASTIRRAGSSRSGRRSTPTGIGTWPPTSRRCWRPTAPTS